MNTETRTIITSHGWSDSEHSYTLESYSDGDVYLTVDNYYYSNQDTNPQNITLCEGWSNMDKIKLEENSNKPIFTYTVTFGSHRIQFTYLAEAENFIDKVNTLVSEIHNSTDRPKFGIINKIKNGYGFKVSDTLTIEIVNIIYKRASYPQIYFHGHKDYTTQSSLNIHDGFTLAKIIAESPNHYSKDIGPLRDEYVIRWFTQSMDGEDIDYYSPTSEEEAIMVYNCLNEIANKLRREKS